MYRAVLKGRKTNLEKLLTAGQSFLLLESISQRQLGCQDFFFSPQSLLPLVALTSLLTQGPNNRQEETALPFSAFYFQSVLESQTALPQISLLWSPGSPTGPSIPLPFSVVSFSSSSQTFLLNMPVSFFFYLFSWSTRLSHYQMSGLWGAFTVYSPILSEASLSPPVTSQSHWHLPSKTSHQIQGLLFLPKFN